MNLVKRIPEFLETFKDEISTISKGRESIIRQIMIKIYNSTKGSLDPAFCRSIISQELDKKLRITNREDNIADISGWEIYSRG